MKNSFVVILLLLFVLPADAQCAMCRAVIESEEGSELATGINNGILYLMIFPYLLVGGIGYIVYRSRKKEKQEV
jgi:LPXTG-motif cell wall-anchored protein